MIRVEKTQHTHDVLPSRYAAESGNAVGRSPEDCVSVSRDSENASTSPRDSVDTDSRVRSRESNPTETTEPPKKSPGLKRPSRVIPGNLQETGKRHKRLEKFHQKTRLQDMKTAACNGITATSTPAPREHEETAVTESRRTSKLATQICSVAIVQVNGDGAGEDNFKGPNANHSSTKTKVVERSDAGTIQRPVTTSLQRTASPAAFDDAERRLEDLRKDSSEAAARSRICRTQNTNPNEMRTTTAVPSKWNDAREAEQRSSQTDNDAAVWQHSTPIITLAEPQPVAVEAYAAWFRRVVVRNRSATWFTTFYLHWILVLIMAAIIVNVPIDTASVLLSAAFATGDAEELPAFEVVSEISTVSSPLRESVEEQVVDVVEREVELDRSIVDEWTGDENPVKSEPAPAVKKVETERQERRNPAPPHAVNRGSFSIWTVPASPHAGQPYRIIVQIELPQNVTRYNLTDLQGIVVGSDGYRKPIPGSLRGNLAICDGFVRFVVPIVGADEHISDTVIIHSRLLQETQRLSVDF